MGPHPDNNLTIIFVLALLPDNAHLIGLSLFASFCVALHVEICDTMNQLEMATD